MILKCGAFITIPDVTQIAYAYNQPLFFSFIFIHIESGTCSNYSSLKFHFFQFPIVKYLPSETFNKYREFIFFAKTSTKLYYFVAISFVSEYHTRSILFRVAVVKLKLKEQLLLHYSHSSIVSAIDSAVSLGISTTY